MSDVVSVVPSGLPPQPDPLPDEHVAYIDLAAAMRELQAALAQAHPPAALSRNLTARLRDMARAATTHRVDEAHRLFARQWNAPGRGQFLVPPYCWRDIGPDHRIGVVHFGQMYLGSGAAAHGGAVSLVYDEALGGLANGRAGIFCRTGTLTIRYRALTPLDVDLAIEVRVDRVEGRKHFLSGRMMHDGQLLTEAEGVFISVESATSTEWTKSKASKP